MQSESIEDNLNSSPSRRSSQQPCPSRCVVDLNAVNPISFRNRSANPPVYSAVDTEVADDRPSSSVKHSLPPISLGTFNMSSSSPSSSPPILRQATSTAATRNGLAKVGRPHRPVVRSQSSRMSLLRQPPTSASSLTSGNDVEHFPMPDKYAIF